MSGRCTVCALRLKQSMLLMQVGSQGPKVRGAGGRRGPNPAKICFYARMHLVGFVTMVTVYCPLSLSSVPPSPSGGSNHKIEEACEMYCRAANMFKMAKNWTGEFPSHTFIIIIVIIIMRGGQTKPRGPNVALCSVSCDSP